MVEIVFQEIVFGKIGDVCGLHMGNVGGSEDTDVHRSMQCSNHDSVITGDAFEYGWMASILGIDSAAKFLSAEELVTEVVLRRPFQVISYGNNNNPYYFNRIQSSFHYWMYVHISSLDPA